MMDIATALVHNKPSNIPGVFIKHSPRGMRMAQDVMRAIADNYGYSTEDIRKPNRSRSLMLARREIAFVLRYELKMSCPDIAELMHRDSSTIVYYSRKTKRNAR